MPIKRDKNKNPFFMSSKTLFVIDGLQDSHWVGYSLINLFGFIVFQKRNSMREGND